MDCYECLTKYPDSSYFSVCTCRVQDMLTTLLVLPEAGYRSLTAFLTFTLGATCDAISCDLGTAKTILLRVKNNNAEPFATTVPARARA
jgi:hypothetical protein